MTIPRWRGLPHGSAGTRHLIPHTERTRSQRTVVHRLEEVAADAKEILHESMDREKPLRLRGGLEPAHLALALPRRLMLHLRSIVLVLPRAVHHRRHHRAMRRGVAAQPVGDQPAGREALIS